MVCPDCSGSGFFSGLIPMPIQCPECQGSGIVSCCDTAGASELAGAFLDLLEKHGGKIVSVDIKLSNSDTEPPDDGYYPDDLA